MIKVGLSNKYKVDPYGTEEILSDASVSAAPILTINYGDEVQEAEFIVRPTKGGGDLNIGSVANILSIKGNTSVIEESLVNCKMSGIKTTGFNQWDEEWIGGNYNDTTGDFYIPSTKYLCSKNPIPVFPNTSYFKKGRLRVFFYDENMVYIDHTNNSETIFATPSRCKYIHFRSNDYVDPTTYNNDICINLSYSGTRNGEYNPYLESILNIPVTTIKGKLIGSGNSVVVFADGIKSAGDVRDEIKVENNILKGIKRVDTRAYQSGDVNSSTMTTDGANFTNYALATPEEYIIDDVSVEKVMLGSTEITKVYLGNQLIFEHLN